MKITLLTLFPEYFGQLAHHSMLKRAIAGGQLELSVVDIRDFALDQRRTADDRPYGGGPGMVMKVEPIAAALASLPTASGKRQTILTSAKGTLFNQQRAVEYAQLSELVIVCGHYEGVDERVAEHLVDAEVRIGDYVLTGGEPAAAVILDAVTRLQPGVLGNETSNQDESHSQPGLLGYPQYTRPEVFNGWSVPDVLLGGDHAAITAWRKAQQHAVDDSESR